MTLRIFNPLPAIKVFNGAGDTFRACFAGTGVSVFSLHPGVVQSDLWRHQRQCIQVAVKIFKIFTKTTVEGAQTTLYCAVEPNLERQSGGYFRYGQHGAGCARTNAVGFFAKARVQPSQNVRSNATQRCHGCCLSLSVLFRAQRLRPGELLEDGL